MLEQTRCAEALAKRPTRLRNSTDIRVLRKEGRQKSVAAWSVVRKYQQFGFGTALIRRLAALLLDVTQARQLSISLSLKFQKASPLLNRKFAPILTRSSASLHQVSVL